MALTIHYRKKSQGVTWKSGHIYSFKYTAYENDPSPDYLHLNSFSGYHPNTGNQWRFHQGINLSYVPRRDRKRFIQIWKDHMQNNKSVRMTWNKVKGQYPYLKLSLRRYFYQPNYYIRKAKEIPIDDWEKQVVKSWGKDFSSTVKKKIASKLKSLFAGRRK